MCLSWNGSSLYMHVSFNPSLKFKNWCCACVCLSVFCVYKRERLVRGSGPKFVTPPLDRQTDITVLYRIAVFPQLHLFPSVLVLALYVAAHFLVQLPKKKIHHMFPVSSWIAVHSEQTQSRLLSCLAALCHRYIFLVWRNSNVVRNVTWVLDIMQLAVGEL